MFKDSFIRVGKKNNELRISVVARRKEMEKRKREVMPSRKQAASIIRVSKYLKAVKKGGRL